jgi:hypothetical protein
MKWQHASAVRTYVVDLFSQLSADVKAEGAEVVPLAPEPDINLGMTHEGIVELLDRDLDAVAFMHAAIDLGYSQASTAGWDAYRDIPYEQELDEHSSFFLEVVEREPPAGHLTGFGVEIAYPSRDGETTADLWLMGGSAYQPNDETWLDVQDH